MKIITCFVKTGDTKKDLELLDEKEKAELANALQKKALKSLLAHSKDITTKEDEQTDEKERIIDTQEE